MAFLFLPLVFAALFFAYTAPYDVVEPFQLFLHSLLYSVPGGRSLVYSSRYSCLNLESSNRIFMLVQSFNWKTSSLSLFLSPASCSFDMSA